MSLAANRTQAIVRPAHAAEVTAAPLAYGGIVTRTIAFAADAAVIQIVAIAVAGTFALILSVLSPPDKFDGVILVVGSTVYCLWLVGYFVVFWSATGQTPGNRLLHIRVCRADAATIPSAGTALIRFFGLIVAALPLFAGFLPILLDDRRRGLHDMLARTVVVSGPPAEITALRP